MKKKHLQKFLQEHPNFTEESIKDLLKQYADNIINKTSLESKKISKDSKIDKMQNMDFRRSNINYYGNSKLNAIAVDEDLELPVIGGIAKSIFGKK